ncbi:hypothetical protein TNCV_4522501, partial [Trichonephila clavipes]
TRQHERNNSTGENNSTRQQERNNSTQEGNKPLTAYNRLQPPAPPLQQNRLFLPTDVLIIIKEFCYLSS